VSWVKVHEPGLSAAARALHPLRLAAAATREPDGRHAGGQFFRDAETGSRKRHDTPVVTLSAPKNVEETFAYIDRQFSARTNPRAFVSSLHGKSMLDPVSPCIVSPVSLSLSLSLSAFLLRKRLLFRLRSLILRRAYRRILRLGDITATARTRVSRVLRIVLRYRSRRRIYALTGKINGGEQREKWEVSKGDSRVGNLYR
jgi:hypothetical protein